MKTFTIHTNLDSYETTEIGEIYVQLDSYSFPEVGWTDFGFNIVFWWLDEFIKLHSMESEKVQCEFMDGSYRFDIKRINDLIWEIEFIAERENDEVREKGEVDGYEATQNLIEISEMLKRKYMIIGNTKAGNNYEIRIQKLINFIKK